MQTSSENDTIFAIASGAGRAAIAVLRLSGPGAALGTFRDPATHLSTGVAKIV